MNIIKGIAKGLKTAVTGGGIKSMIPFAERGLDTIKEIKTDPVKRWEKLGELIVYAALMAALLYLIATGKLSVADATEIIETIP